MSEIFDCTAYGPEATAIGVLCFFAERGQRDCASLEQCTERMTDERQRVWSRLNELAAQGDPVGQFLAGAFPDPEDILNATGVDDENEGL